MAARTSSTEKKHTSFPSFLRRGKIGSYLTIVMAGQIPYSSFEAFKGALLLPLCAMLGITEGQFGDLMGWIGIAMFLYVPGGWINNRFTIRSILLAWSGWRLVTYMILFLIPQLPFSIMVAIAISWGVWDAIGWPAVVNGISFLSADSNEKGRGLAMGLLETIRRGAEMLMNLIIVGLIAFRPENTKSIMLCFAIIYALLLIPLMAALLKIVPKNAIATSEKNHSANMNALLGLVHVLLRPRVWLAGIAALCVYWTYVNIIYGSAPYLSIVYNASEGVSGAFGIFNTGLVGVFAGLVSGIAADYLFKSSTMMMAVALTVAALGAAAVYFIPVGNSGMYTAMILLMVMAIGTFMGKAVILAPIAELHLPAEINGSAMSVGSFLAYASVFWANPMNGRILESAKAAGNAGDAYSKIFLITLCVAAIGAVCAFLLWSINRRVDRTRAIA